MFMFSLKDLKNRYKSLPDQVKAALWFTVSNFIQSGISYLSTPVFTRIMSTGDYGIFSVYMTWQNIVSIFVTLNLASGVYMRGLIKYDDDRKKFTASVQGLFVLLFLLYLIPAVFFLDGLSDILAMPRGYILGMMTDLFFVMSFRFWSVRKRVDYEYKRMVFLTLFNALLKTGLELFAVIKFKNGAAGRIYALVIADVISFGWLWVKMFIDTIKDFSPKYWKYSLGYNIPLVPHYLSQVIMNQSDRIMIKDMCGEDEAGKYSLAYNLATAVQILSQAILNAYNPWMYQQIKKKNYKEVNAFSMLLLYLIAALCLMLMLLAPEVMWIFAPQDYYEAVKIIPCVTISVYFVFLYSLYANFEFYFEKNSYMMVASSVAACLNIWLNMIFIGSHGYMAAAYTTLFCYIAYTLFHYVVMRLIVYKETGLKSIYDDGKIFLLSAGLVALSILFFVLYDHIIIRYLCAFVLLAVLIWKRETILTELKKNKLSGGKHGK